MSRLKLCQTCRGTGFVPDPTPGMEEFWFVCDDCGGEGYEAPEDNKRPPSGKEEE